MHTWNIRAAVSALMVFAFAHPLVTGAQDRSSVSTAKSDMSAVARRGSTEEIQVAGERLQQALLANWFGGGQAVSEVTGCLVTLQATKTVGKSSALLVYRFDAGQIDDSLSKRLNDSDAMVSAYRFARRDGARFVVRDSSAVLPSRSAAVTDSVDYVELGAAYGNPGRRLEMMVTSLLALRAVCRSPTTVDIKNPQYARTRIARPSPNDPRSSLHQSVPIRVSLFSKPGGLTELAEHEATY